MILKNLFFPPKCVFCQKVLPITQKLPNLCPDCSGKLLKLPVRSCVKCGKPMDAGFDKPFCMFCTKKITGLDGVVAPFMYEHGVRESILRFKFSNKPYYAASYAEFIYERLSDYRLDKSFDAIVPVPVSKKRLLSRGYNQSMRTAKYLAKLSGKPVLNCLKKILECPPQSTLALADRKKNLQGAIVMKPLSSPPRSVLLVDDVYTTGTTASVCAKALHKGGVPHVLVCTVAMHLPGAELPEN